MQFVEKKILSGNIEVTIWFRHCLACCNNLQKQSETSLVNEAPVISLLPRKEQKKSDYQKPSVLLKLVANFKQGYRN